MASCLRRLLIACGSSSRTSHWAGVSSRLRYAQLALELPSTTLVATLGRRALHQAYIPFPQCSQIIAYSPRYNEFHRELLRWSRVSGLAPTATAFNRSRLTSSSSSGLRRYWSAACYLVSHEGATGILRQYWPDAPSLGPSTVIDTRSQNLPVADHLLLNTTGAYIAAPLLSQPAEGGTHDVGSISKRYSRWNALHTYYPG